MRPTVLIVDDTELLRFLLREALAVLPLGLVAEAGTPEEAIRLARALAPQLVVVDWTGPLPADSLTATLHRLCPGAVVVAAVDAGDSQARKRALTAGATAILDRPYTAGETLPLLQSLLGPTQPATV